MEKYLLHPIVILGFVISLAAEEKLWEIQLENFFQEGTKPLFIYAHERNGEWISAVGSSRDPARQGRKTYNVSWYYVDMSAIPIRDNKITGQFTLHITPDNWVPLDHKSFTADFKINAEIVNNVISGSYETVSINTKDPTAQKFGQRGKVISLPPTPYSPKPIPESYTLQCNLWGALTGGDPSFGDRCLVVYLGIENNKIISTARATISQKKTINEFTPFTTQAANYSRDGEAFNAHIEVPATTLDMEPCIYVIDIKGKFYTGLLVGIFKSTTVVDGKSVASYEGSFDGNWSAGVKKYEIDEQPWYSDVKGFVPPQPGEHPRLLFRKSDLPYLRKKAQTEEGKAIITRLRYLLDGKDGESMTTVFNPSKQAYTTDEKNEPSIKTPGCYTIGHIVGYGLLYQLTGDKKYAEFGKQCFEKALEGVRDRDDRYSFRKPGGPLRAGPSIGWYAIGYDLCYDGWDEATREKFTRAIAEYAEVTGEGDGAKGRPITLELLIRGTMPPESNHYGMQVGGAALALMAVMGEKWVDQKKIDSLIKIAEYSLIRNIKEGFGDGGFFPEGDGTGSMSSHIIYLTALLGMKNALGKDFINVERPNARMTALKWIYMTVFRNGKLDFWPIRGNYGHNVWSRYGLSGAAYIAQAFGAIRDHEKGAVKWIYNKFMLENDKKLGGPYDTVSPYPQYSVIAFINWPIDIPEVNPVEVLPRCYRDSKYGFYCWRNRWKDGDDTVISILTSRTEGYMVSRPDKQFKLNTMGKHISWGNINGDVKYWSKTPMGETSSLTFSDGTSVGIDFTGSSGVDTMIVITDKNSEGVKVDLDKYTLTFFFPTVATPPQPTKEGEKVRIGNQTVWIENGHIEFGIKGK